MYTKYFIRFLVELMGFEPTTSSMPSRRAPNCATAPPEQLLTMLTSSRWIRLSAAKIDERKLLTRTGITIRSCGGKMHFMKRMDSAVRLVFFLPKACATVGVTLMLAFAMGVAPGLVVPGAAAQGVAPTEQKAEAKAARAVKFIAEVELLDCDGTPCVEARIGEGKPVKMGIDTGNKDSILDKDVADAAGLKATSAMPAGAPAGMFRTTIPAVRIGGATLHEVAALGMSLSEMVAQKQMPNVAGTLAYTAFKDRMVQLDFVANKLRISELLTAAAPCSGTCDKFSLITFGKKGPPIVVAEGFEINGKAMSAQVDTMYTGTMVVYTASIDKLGLSDAAKTERNENFPLTDGGVDMKAAPAQKESFHGLALGVSAPVVYFPTPDVHEPDGLFDATVGLGVFYGSVLTLDFRDMTISVSRP
jgi:hypothetical protein